MEVSYCWSPRRPSNYAELIRISLPGWTVSQCDYTHPFRTRVGSAHLADWGCVLPLITESAPLSKLHQGRKISDDGQHLVFSVPPKFPMWETASAPSLIQCLEGDHVTCLCQWNTSVFGWKLYEPAPAPFPSSEMMEAGSPWKPGSLRD